MKNFEKTKTNYVVTSKKSGNFLIQNKFLNNTLGQEQSMTKCTACDMGQHILHTIQLFRKWIIDVDGKDFPVSFPCNTGQRHSINNRKTHQRA